MSKNKAASGGLILWHFFDMADIKEIRKRLLDAADSVADRVTELCDSFFENPELGFEEHRTSAGMQGFLRDSGFEVEHGVAAMPTAFRARFGSGRPTVALMAEMDALPGIGHGCGHNIAGMASAGAGAALSAALKDYLRPGEGSVVILGTPAEEVGRGKADMIEAGIFDDIDAAMMVHPSSARTVVKHFLGLVELRFTFHGRASHASAYPEEGVNALDAVIQTFNSVNALRQMLPPEARVHGIITDGGKIPNIIPERAEALFYVRAADLKTLDSIVERVKRCAEGAASATGTSLEATRAGKATAPMKLNTAFADIYRRALNLLDLPEDPKPPYKNVGSSDIGDVSHVVPAIHPQVPVREGIRIHTEEFAEATATPDGHRALMEGVRCLGLTAIELLFDPDALKAVKYDFDHPET